MKRQSYHHIETKSLDLLCKSIDWFLYDGHFGFLYCKYVSRGDLLGQSISSSVIVESIDVLTLFNVEKRLSKITFVIRAIKIILTHLFRFSDVFRG